MTMMKISEVQQSQLGSSSSHGERSLQHVVEQSSKAKVVAWMVKTFENDGLNNLKEKTGRRFPEHFRGNMKANLEKASGWWRKREKILQKSRSNPRYVSSRQDSIRRQVHTKAAPGRGPSRAAWVEWLLVELKEELERLRAAGMKFESKLLLALAKDIVKSSEDEFNENYTDAKDGKLIVQKLTYSWITMFSERFNTVPRAAKGKRSLSPAKTEFIEKSVAYHLGCVKRKFDSGELDENLVENIDQIHFIINMDNGKSLGFIGDDSVKYADVVSGGDGVTMIVRITGRGKRFIGSSVHDFQRQELQISYPWMPG